MKAKKFLFIASCILAIVICFRKIVLSEITYPKKNIDYDDLTYEQEIGQLIMLSVDLHRIDAYEKIIKKGLIGGVLLQWGDYSLEETRQLVEKLQSWAKVPLLIAADYEGGITLSPTSLGLVNLPTNMMIGAANDEKDTAALFYLAGMELKRAGINVNFAPVLDVNTNMHNPVIGVRSFGSDEETVSKLGTAVINGLQASGVMAVAKHFPGHGDISLDTHKSAAVSNMSLAKLENIHLKPFKSAIDAGVMGIMTAHILYTELDNENIATFSPKILKNYLRKKLMFEGVIVSDSLDMKAVTDYNNIWQAGVKAIKAGADIIIVRGANPYKVYEEIRRELGVSLKPSQIYKASKKIFETKKKLGLFNGHDYKIPASDKAYQEIASSVSKKAITLVRNDQNLIPFDTKSEKKVCTVFFAPSRFSQELLNINKPFMKEGWLVTQYNAQPIPRNKDLKYASECVQNSDLAIVGSFQWANKPYFSQIRVINELLKINKPVVLVSLMSPFDIRFYLRAKTVLATYGITSYSIEGLAQAVLGHLKPEGKLPVKLLPFEIMSEGEVER